LRKNIVEPLVVRRTRTDIEKYFENKTILNKKLYLKQRNYLQEKHPELQWLINLIKKHSGVLEQEIFN
jgi:UTP-glucose-1-phosphate uridylyltransferase